MYLDAENPVFRKKIIPWYDTNVLCVVMIVFMLFVFAFAIIGIIAAGDMPREKLLQAYEGVEPADIPDSMVPGESDFHRGVWAPVFLLLASVSVIISSSARLIVRKFAENEE